MALRPPSLQKTYDEYSPYDPAFTQLAADATEDDRKAWFALVETARETGDWSTLLVPGGNPTKFVLRPLPGDVYRALSDMWQLGRNDSQITALFFRAALKAVSNLEDHATEVKLTTAAGVPGKIADVAVANMLDALDKRIVADLGDAVIKRGQAIAPRS